MPRPRPATRPSRTSLSSRLADRVGGERCSTTLSKIALVLRHAIQPAAQPHSARGWSLALFKRLRRAGIGLGLIVHAGDHRPGPAAHRQLHPAAAGGALSALSRTTAGRSTASSCSAARSRHPIRPPAARIVANESAERVLDTIQLAHRYPNARILISGGGGTVFGDGAAEAPIIADYFKSIGIDPARILVEDRSRTTAENAVYSRELAKPQRGRALASGDIGLAHAARGRRVREGRVSGHALSGRFPHRRRRREHTPLRLRLGGLAAARCRHEGMGGPDRLLRVRPHRRGCSPALRIPQAAAPAGRCRGNRQDRPAAPCAG